MSHSKLDNYVVLETIGKGTFGLRQKVSRISDKAPFEWQEINYRPMDDATREKVIHEIDSLKKLRQPNVVRYEDVIVKRDTNMLYLITECCGKDTLQTLIDYHREKKKIILENVIWTVLSQLCLGLHSLSSTQDSHRNKISHLCLKPSCVFLQKDTIKIKIGDFGLGLLSKSYYKCPEMEQSGNLNDKTDVWSMGCIIYELCNLKKPFEDIKEGSSESTQWRFPNLPPNYTGGLGAMLRFILTVDHNTRPSALMILHHPIMKSNELIQTNKLNTAHSVCDETTGVLETDFPVAKDMTVAVEELHLAEPMSHSDISLNHYLSIIGDDNGSVLDDVDICSIENGTALPKATSSILHSSPYTTPSKVYKASELGPKKGHRFHAETSSASNAIDLDQMESHLHRWAKMLEEKEKELAHKERRLLLWETQLQEIELSQQKKKISSTAWNQNQLKPTAEATFYHGMKTESSDVETDANSTVSTYPADSILVPTVVRMEPSKIRNPFTHYNYEKHVRFCDDDNSHFHQPNNSTKSFTEERLHWLELKKKKHLAPISTLHDQVANDYIVLEEKSIASSHHRRRIKTNAQLTPKSFIARNLPNAVEKENTAHELNHERFAHSRLVRPPKINDSKILSSELRAKLKSHNLPGLR